MHIREDATGTGERNSDNHEKLEDDAGGFIFNVARENDGGDEEDGGDNHDVGRREGRFAGAVGAGGEDEDTVKNQIGDSYEDDWNGHPSDFGVDFGEIFVFDPLA